MLNSRKTGLFIIVFCINVFFSSAHSETTEDTSQILAPGYGSLLFTAAKPGSYQLPMIAAATNGDVINSDGQAFSLFDLMGDKIVLLSFIYTRCSDVNGCPLATMVFHRIKRQLAKQPELAKQLRLLSLSFDPLHDTPEQMQHYAQGLSDKHIDWQFLTTETEQQLQPILKNYRQSIQKQYTKNGQFNGTYAHILRVYLIDKKKRIRNIYSVSFLHPETLLNDVRTLLLTSPAPTIAEYDDQQAFYRAGDNKSGYQHSDYQTQSIALTERTGVATDLLQFVRQPPLGLPAVPVPENNPISLAKILLGRQLFYDRRLSLNNTFSCAMCHIPEQGFSSNEMKTAVGIEGRSVRRNSPTLYNVSYYTTLFHDSRENSLEQQVWGPLLANNEMGNPSIGYVLHKINQLPQYQSLFKQAFGRGPSMETLGMALASYQRTLNSANSAFDRWYYAKQKQALSHTAQRGLLLFQGKAGCSACHLINQKYALFTDNKTHNTGIGYAESMQKTPATQRIQVAPGVFVNIDSDIIKPVSAAKPNDLGRYEISQNPAHRWHYKTPSLRNISLTAPYMHNGSLGTLTEVVEFYNAGGRANENLDPLIKPLHLSNQEITQLVAFLHALTGSNVNQLVADAFAVPVGDI